MHGLLLAGGVLIGAGITGVATQPGWAAGTMLGSLLVGLSAVIQFTRKD